MSFIRGTYLKKVSGVIEGAIVKFGDGKEIITRDIKFKNILKRDKIRVDVWINGDLFGTLFFVNRDDNDNEDEEDSNKKSWIFRHYEVPSSELSRGFYFNDLEATKELVIDDLTSETTYEYCQTTYYKETMLHRDIEKILEVGDVNESFIINKT